MFGDQQCLGHMLLIVEFLGALIFAQSITLLAMSQSPVPPSDQMMGALATAHCCLLCLFAKHWFTGAYEELEALLIAVDALVHLAFAAAYTHAAVPALTAATAAGATASSQDARHHHID